MLASADRLAITRNATSAGDATGHMHPGDRTKVAIAYGYGLTGAGVTIGIIDTGYNLVNGDFSHQEFSTAGKATVIASSPTLTSDAHGTHVAGLAAADRNGLGMQGLAYNAKVLVSMVPDAGSGLARAFADFTAGGALVSNNSWGYQADKTTGQSPWNPIQNPGFVEVMAKDAIAYRDRAGITSAQAMANIYSGDAAGWTQAVANMQAFQARGGVIVWSNSNFGANDITAGRTGLTDAENTSALPLMFPQLRGGWIVATNATSIGLAIQASGQAEVNAGTKKEGNIWLNSNGCGAAAAFCLSMDGTAVWSGSNGGVATYESQTGTSQAGPQIAGLVALLREAFPAASAADLAARLLFTADNSFFINGTVSNKTVASYTNANGTISHTVSDIWGHGFADMQNALAPVGTARSKTASGQSIELAQIAGTQVQLARAFGGGSAIADATYLYNDMLDGVFVASLRNSVGSVADTSMFESVNGQMLARDMVSASNENGLTFNMAQSFGTAGAANRYRPDVAFSIRQTIGRTSSVAAGFGFSADSALGFTPRHAGLRNASLSDSSMGIPYLSFGNDGQSWVATSSRIGTLGVTVAAFGSTGVQTVQDRPRYFAPLASGRGLQFGTGGATSGAVADLVWDGLAFARLNVSLGQVRESGSFLGSVATGNLLRQGADTSFVRVGFQMPLGSGFGLQGNYTTANTNVRGGGLGLLASVSGLRTEAMSMMVTGDNLIGQSSRLSLGISQPLRVANGRGTLNLPQQLIVDAPGSYRYGYATDAIGLAPRGREIDYTVEYSQRLGPRMSWGVTGRLISQPGHIETAPLAAQGLISLKFAM